MTDWDTVMEWRARLKRARKAAKRAEDTRKTEASKALRRQTQAALEPSGPTGVVMRLVTIPNHKLWGYWTHPRGFWDRHRPTPRAAAEPRWRQRLTYRRSLPMVGREWWRSMGQRLRQVRRVHRRTGARMRRVEVS